MKRTFEDIFPYGAWENVPALDELLGDSRQIGKIATRPEVNVFLNLIRKICIGNSWKPLITELSVIEDPRSASSVSQLLFSAHLQTPIELAPLIMGRSGETKGHGLSQENETPYIEALTYMTLYHPIGAKGAEPIVPHPDLSDPDSGYITFNCEEVTQLESRFPFQEIPRTAIAPDLSKYEAPTSQSVHYTPFGVPTTKVENQTKVFVSRLLLGLRNFCEEAAAHKKGWIFNTILKSRFLLVPFLRPTAGYFSKVTTPGAVLFLFLQNPSDSQSDTNLSTDTLTRDLLFLFYLSANKEARKVAEESRARARLVEAMVHNTRGIIRTLQTGEFRDILTDVPKLTSPDEMRFRLVDRQTSQPNEETEHTEREMINSVNYLMDTEKYAIAQLSMAEIAASPGFLRNKFQETTGIFLQDLILNVAAQLKKVRDPKTGKPFPELLLLQIDRLKADCRWLVPEGYLNSEIIFGLIFEILLNAQKYAICEKHDGEESVVVEYTIQQVQDKDIVQLVFINKISEQQLYNLLGVYQPPVELKELRENPKFGSLLPGINYRAYVDGWNYRVVLSFGKILCENDQEKDFFYRTIINHE